MSQKSLIVKIAGLCIEVNMENLKSFAHLEPRFKSFLTDSKPDFIVKVGENGQYIKLDDISTVEKKGRKIFIVATLDFPVTDQTNKSFAKRQLSRTRTEIGFIDLKNRIAEIDLPGNHGLFILSSFLRIILELVLASNWGILVHASGVVKDGGGYLFVGAPDSGKSTVAKASKAKGLRVLSDDCICVRKMNGSFYSFGTPWGRLISKDSGILRRIFFLRKGKTLEFRKMAASKLIEGLFWHGRFTHLNFSLTEGILNTINEVATSIPSYEMPFSLNDNIWEGIKRWEK